MDFGSILKTVKDYWQSFDLEAKLANYGITYTVPVQAALCFGIGFANGFLFKKYFKFFIMLIICTSIAIAVLDYNHIVTINWESLRVMFGFAPKATTNGMITQMFDWVKENIVVFLSALIGFLFGYKLG